MKNLNTTAIATVTIANAFSLQMLDGSVVGAKFKELTLVEMQEVVKGGVNSAIGHPDTANVLTSILGVEIPANRVNVSLKGGDVVYVAQLTGGRLPEGATTLPEGFKFKFIKVTCLGE